MHHKRFIADLLATSQPVLSVEFFPPKNEEGGNLIVQTALDLKTVHAPDFVSITYGAGGTTRDRTIKYAKILKEEYHYEVMPHLTCVGSSKAELLEIIKGYQRAGFCNIMALRGDPPRGDKNFQPHPDGLRHGSDLVRFIRKQTPSICIGVAGYPETHPEASSPASDLEHLKYKVDQGASFITTQLFYDNKHYYSFVERCRAKDILVPIVPGILPVLSLTQVKRFCALCGTSIPSALKAKLEAAGNNTAAILQVGIDWAYQQVKNLLEKGAPGIHLYILNRSESALALIGKLKKDGLL